MREALPDARGSLLQVEVACPAAGGVQEGAESERSNVAKFEVKR